MIVSTGDFLMDLRERQLGKMSNGAFQTRAGRIGPSSVKAELERTYPQVFLEHLQESIKRDEYLSLIERVTFDGEKLSPSLLVKRLIVREYANLRGLSQYDQSPEWHATVNPFLDCGNPPELMSVEEYFVLNRGSSLPFARLPIPVYAQPGETNGMAQLYLILSLSQAVNAIVKAVVE